MTVIKFKTTRTNHIVLKAKINGYTGLFIVDTGASNTCISKHAIQAFKLVLEDNINNSAGAGGNVNTETSLNNHFQISYIEIHDLDVIVMNMDHINNVLISCDELPIHGIIGADILIHLNTVIDYEKQTITFNQK